MIEAQLKYAGQEAKRVLSYIEKNWKGSDNKVLAIMQNDEPFLSKNYFYITDIEAGSESQWYAVFTASTIEEFWRKLYSLPMHLYYQVLEGLY